jgi:hypothetical protein
MKRIGLKFGEDN